MDGQVLAGVHAGSTLSALQIPELRELLKECLADADSLSLLTAYLENRFGADWQVHFGLESERREGGQKGPAQHSGGMSKQEACEILGVQENSPRE